MQASNNDRPGKISQVLSLRLKLAQMDRLQRIAKQFGRTASEVGAMLIDEGLRRSEFGLIDYRSTMSGRQAFIQGSSLAVWEVVFIARNYKMDPEKTAKHLDWSVFRVQAAFNYAAAFTAEIDDAIAENVSYDYLKLSRSLPQAELFVAETGKDKASVPGHGQSRVKRTSKKRQV